ncbi:MAG: glycosyltransferase family 2 protein [Actinomycetota bacterium]|nr:glycosyltransferase family 2 protein [Actinomycetota bacterium]
MLVFLDSDAPDAESYLRSHPHVTCVRTDEDWWRRGRPALLNERHNTNANVTKAALTRFPWAEWLFHIDSEEVVLVDRHRLEELDTRPPSRSC